MTRILLAALLAAQSCAPQPGRQAARQALDADSWAAAEWLLEPLPREAPACPDVLVAWGQFHLGRRNYPEAQRVLEQAN